MRSRTWALLFVLVLVGAACSSSKESGDSGDGGSGEGREIGILVNGPMTGYSGEYGTDMCKGAELAAEHINDEGGVKSGPMEGATLRVECADNPEFSTDVAATIASRYLSDENLWASVGYASSAEALAASKVVQSSGLSIVASAVGASFLTTEADNIVALFPYTASVGFAITDFCNAYFGGKTIGQAIASYSFFDSYLEGQQSALSKNGMELVSDLRYDPGSVSDFSPFLARIKASNPDCVFPGDYPPLEEQMVKEGRALGMDQPFLDFIAAGPSQSGLETGGEELVGFIYANFVPFEKEEGSEWAKVSAEWEDLYAKPMGYYPAYGYDSVLTVEYALEDGASSREELLGYLAKVDGPGLIGPIKFNSDLREVERPFELLELTGTTLEDLEEVGRYTLLPDGSARRDFTADCGSRPTCQLSRS